MKADVGALLFIQDKLDATKRRPYICVHIFTNTAGVPYNWLIAPITSKDSVGTNNLVKLSHSKLGSDVSYAKINNIETISWSDKIEIATQKFANKHTRSVQDKLGEIFKRKESKN